MSAILARLNAVFHGVPIILAPVPTAGPPAGSHLRALADHLVALANHRDGGVLVLGLDRCRPHRALGVADPRAWTAALLHLADTLDPPIEIDVETGEEDGRAIVAVHVPHAAVPRGHVRRPDGPPMHLVDGRPTPYFEPLQHAPRRAPPLLVPITGSTPAWLDPDATRALATGAPAAWSLDTRAVLARDGLLAPDGVALTRVGLLLAALPEHRPDADGVVLEVGDRVVELQCGWLILRDQLLAEARDSGVRHAGLVADLVLDVLVRTAGPTSTCPVVVDLCPELLTIEAPAAVRDDPELAARMARWGGWHSDRWRAPSVGWHLPVMWERQGAGLRVVAHLVRPEHPVVPSNVRATPRPVAGSRAASPASAAVVAPAVAPPPVPASPEAHQPRGVREPAVLALLADGRAWTRRELDARLGWSRSTLRTVLENLVRDGRVLADASSPRSPFQAYRSA